MNIFTKLAYDHLIDVKGDSPLIPGNRRQRKAVLEKSKLPERSKPSSEHG